MKLASIITMHYPLNYGAVLQSYALQTYLKSLGLDVSIINYRPRYMVNNQSLMYIGDPKFKRNFFLRWAYRIVKAPVKYKQKRYFARFSQNELTLTPPYSTYEALCDANINSDYFFCGSDQIWNSTNNTCKDPAYFLGFVKDKSKRNSYAASGNMHLPLAGDVINYSIPMINELEHISMREDVTISNIQPLIAKKIEHVCDPALLLTKDQWIELMNRGNKLSVNKRYVLIYPMSDDARHVIENGYALAKAKGIPLYCITSSQRRDCRINRYFNISPYTFLSLLYHADYIVTNSFHGTVFSIIFQKVFWSCTVECSTQRISSLLDKLGLNNRFVAYGKLLSVDDTTINYGQCSKALNSFIDDSKKYIDRIISQ